MIHFLFSVLMALGKVMLVIYLCAWLTLIALVAGMVACVWLMVAVTRNKHKFGGLS